MSHPNREVEFRCSHHKTFACPMCLRDAHRYCSRIEPIERIEQKDRDTHLLKFISKLKSVKESAETLIATNKKIQQENTTQAVEMIRHQYNIINRLKGLTHFLECDFSMECHEILESETAKLSVNDAASSDLIKAINGDLSLAESLNKYGSDLQIAVQNNKIDNTLTNRTEELSKLENSLKNYTKK